MRTSPLRSSRRWYPGVCFSAILAVAPLTAILPAETKGPKEKPPEKEKDKEKKKDRDKGKGKARKAAEGNLRIPSELPEDVRKALDDAVLAFESAEKADKNRDKALSGAISKLKSAGAKTPETPLPLYYMGMAYERKRDLPEAKKALEKAIKLNPKFHEALCELAGVHGRELDRKRAIEVYDRALQIQPSYAPALQGKAWTLIALDRLGEAKKHLLELQKVEPNPVLKEILEKLEKEIQGPGWNTTFTRETENYIVLTQVSQEYADEIASHAELIRRAYNKIFSDIEKPERKYRILVYRDRQAYLQGGAPPPSAGYYDSFVRKLVIYKQSPQKETLSTLYHEAFHQYLQDYQADAPQWFNEGLGDYFGAYEYAREGKRELMRSRPDMSRLAYAQSAIRSKTCPPASELMVMSQKEMYHPQMIGVHYAQSWAMIYFMIEGNKPKYKPVLINYFKALQKGLDIKAAYAATFGKIDMQRFDADWKGFVMGLSVQSPQ